MNSENSPMIYFFKEVESYFKSKKISPIDNVQLQEINLKSSECFFIFDLTENSIIHFGGIKKMFRYDLKI